MYCIEINSNSFQLNVKKNFVFDYIQYYNDDMKIVINLIHKNLLPLFVHTLKLYDSFYTYGDTRGLEVL